MLGELGCRVEEAGDGAEALARAANLGGTAAEGVLVIMDVGLPDQDGHQVARRLRESVASPGGPAMHIVAHSASAFDHQRDEYLKSGFDDFLAKPVTWQSLEACLRRVPGLSLPVPP